MASIVIFRIKYCQKNKRDQIDKFKDATFFSQTRFQLMLQVITCMLFYALMK